MAELSVFPNPASGSMQIAVSVTKDSKISLSIFNLLGEKVADIAEENLNAGTASYLVDGQKLTTGVYLCRMVITSGQEVKTLVKRIVKE